MNAILSLTITTALLPVASAQDTRIIKEWKMARMDEAKSKEWLARWEKNIINDERNRYCDKAVGEDVLVALPTRATRDLNEGQPHRPFQSCTRWPVRAVSHKV